MADIETDASDPEVQPDADAMPDLPVHVLGAPDAPSTIVEYGDYECPYCAGAAPVLRELVERSEGRVRLEFRNFPLFAVHPHALAAALAAESTVASGAFWRMHMVLFEKQTRLSEFDLRLYAEHVGADPDLAVGPAAEAFADKVRTDYARGIEDGVRGTPTLFIDGRPYAGRVELEELRRATGLAAATRPRRRPLLGRR